MLSKGFVLFDSEYKKFSCSVEKKIAKSEEYKKYKQYINFLLSVAVKIANSEDNRNEFEKVILKKMMIYKIYKASETCDEDSKMNKRELLELACIYGQLNLKSSFYSEFLNIIFEILGTIENKNYFKKIEIIKEMLSFAR